MGHFFSQNPWRRNERKKHPFKAVHKLALLQIWIVGIGAILMIEVSGLIWAGSWPPNLRIATHSFILLLGLFGIFMISFKIPTYEIQDMMAQQLSSGMLHVDKRRARQSKVTIVAQSFLHHGLETSWVATVDGRDFSYRSQELVPVAVPKDYFARIRNRPSYAPEIPEDPPQSAIQALAAVWDCNLITRHDEVTVDEVLLALNQESEDSLPMNEEQLTAGLQELVILNLVKSKVRGLGRGRARYYSTTGAGRITLAAHSRRLGHEIYDNAGRERPVTTIHNTGVIISGSPGATANLGSGSITTIVTPQTLTELQRICDNSQALLSQLENPALREELREALDDLKHELDHASPKERHLKRAARIITEIAGNGLSGLLGNASWNVLAAWLQ